MTKEFNPVKNIYVDDNEVRHVEHDEVHHVEKVENDNVNHPAHYTSDPSGIECIQITRWRNFNIGNALKYLFRHGLKDENAAIQDLKKAIWYIQDEINRLEGKYDK